MPFRIYMIIAVFFFGVLMLISAFFGEDIAIWGNEQKSQAQIRGQDAVGTIVFDPLVAVFENDLIGPIIAALLWPATLIWLLFILIGILIIAGVDVASDVDEVTRLFLL